MSPALERLGVTVPDTSDNVLAFIPSKYFDDLGEALDTLGALYGQGLLAARPAAGTAGRLYFATDTPTLIYYDTGSAWVTLGSPPPSDPAAGTAGLRTLGVGPLQAAAGNHGHGLAAITDADTGLQLPAQWAVPGAEVPGTTTTITSVAAGPTTVVAGPAAGRRIVKALTVSAPAAGMTVTLTLAGLTLARLAFPSAGHIDITCVLPIAPGENLQATVTGGTSVITARWADRATTTLDRLAYTSTAAAGVELIPAGDARTINQIWIANPSAVTTASCSLAISGTTITPVIALPVSGMVHLDTPLTLTDAQALTCTGDGVTALTHLIVGR